QPERQQGERGRQVAAPGGRAERGELQRLHAGEANGVAARAAAAQHERRQREREREQGEQPERVGEAHLSLLPSCRSQSPSVDTTTCSTRSRRSSRATCARRSASKAAKRSRTG